MKTQIWRENRSVLFTFAQKLERGLCFSLWIIRIPLMYVKGKGNMKREPNKIQLIYKKVAHCMWD